MNFFKADFVRNKLVDDDFEADLNDHNAEYIEQFIAAIPNVVLPNADRLPPRRFDPLMLNGVRVTFDPQILFRRVTKTNKVKSGALMLRYGKNKTLPAAVGDWQSAGIYAYLRTLEEAEKTEAERALCITLDAANGKSYEAPSNAVYLFNEMKAACATINERWPAIKPPKNAVL